MSKKKDTRQREIGAENMIRFYDTDLIDRLNRRFQSSECRYENRNHFLTDLIEAGLDRREYENNLRGELLKNDAAMYRSVDELSARLTELGEYVRTQFQSMNASDYIIKEILCGIYNLSEATVFRKIVTPEQICSGKYDFIPERFKQKQELAERMFVK